MSTKTRNQNPVVGDTIKLKLFTQNSNSFADVFSIDHIDIVQKTCKEDKDGDRIDKDNFIIQTIPGTDVTHICTGTYSIDLATSAPTYIIGRYNDVWNVIFRENDVVSKISQDFQIYPDLWIASPTPVVYGFDFSFTPNRIRKGSITWLIIQINPNVPRATDLVRYYHNLAISANLTISIELNCGHCPPAEQDLRLIVDNEPVTERDKVHSFFKIDTSDWECGIYDVWFTLCLADTKTISPRQQIQIY